MRFKYLILLVSCFMLITENAVGEITLKDIFSIPGQINIKTGDVGKATTRNDIKKALKERLASVLETKKNRPNEKIDILSALINNVVNGLQRSGGYVFGKYGTQLSKATLQDFNEIIESTLEVEPILLSPAILNKPNQTTIDPGTKWAGAKPEDEPENAQTPKTFELPLLQWINFLKYYDQQHNDIQGDYYVLNPIKIYNDFVKEQEEVAAKEQRKKADEAKEEAEAKKKADEDERLRKEQEDAKAKEESATTEMQALLLRKKDAKETAKKKEAAINIQALLKTKAESKAKAEAKSAITEMQAILKGAAEAKKKAEEQKKKDDEAKEEARIKEEEEEERKATEDAVAKKKADEEQQKKDAKAKEAAEEPAKKTPPLEHPTKTRARPKLQRRPTQFGKKSQQQKQALEEKQLEHQKKVETLSDLINLAEAKISTSEGEMPTYQAFKYNKLTQEQLDTLKKELESKINEANQYTDLEVLLPTLIEELYKTNKELENDIGMLTEMLNVLFPNLEDIKQFGTKILDISKMVIKLEPQECIKMIINLIDSTTLIAGIVKVKSYEKINDKTRKLLTSAISEFKTKIISLINRLTEQVDTITIQTTIDNLGDKEFKHIEQAFSNLNYAPSERQTNLKLDIIIKAIENRTQKTKFEQDKKAQDAAEAAAAAAEAAQEKKLAAASAKKQGEETAKAKIKQEWALEIAKIQQIAPENIQISDLDFIKEDKYKELNFDATSSSLMLKFIQRLCKQLDQKNDEYLEKLSTLLIIIKNKTCFGKDSQQQKDFNLCEQYVNTWNLLNKIYQKRTVTVENVSVSKIGLTKAQTFALKQSTDPNISEITDYANQLKDTKKHPNLSPLLKNMIQENIITSEKLQIICTILFNVLDSNYEALVTAVKESSTSVKGIRQPKSQPAGTQQKASVKTTKPQTPKSPSPATPKSHEQPEPTALKQKLTYLKQKLTYLKQNLAKLKIKLTHLSQKLEQLKTALPKKEI